MASCKRYIAPVVLKKVSIALETNLLADSTVKKSSDVKTVGQEVVTMDFSQTSFNQDWDR